MLKADKRNALHKSNLIRMLINILDDQFLSENLFFKGGTCASMLGYLDRFSVDLDFDIKSYDVKSEISKRLEKIFQNLHYEIKDKSLNTVQYFIKYPAPENTRSILKIDAVEIPFVNNTYETILLPEINKFAICQTKETLFANKLVALKERYEKNGSIAARDLYDINQFFRNGFAYNEKLIVERRKVDVKKYLIELIKFIESKVTNTIIDQDLNVLLDLSEFNSVRKTLKDETLAFLRNELA